MIKAAARLSNPSASSAPPVSSVMRANHSNLHEARHLPMRRKAEQFRHAVLAEQKRGHEAQNAEHIGLEPIEREKMRRGNGWRRNESSHRLGAVHYLCLLLLSSPQRAMYLKF